MEAFLIISLIGFYFGRLIIFKFQNSMPIAILKLKLFSKNNTKN